MFNTNNSCPFLFYNFYDKLENMKLNLRNNIMFRGFETSGLVKIKKDKSIKAERENEVDPNNEIIEILAENYIDKDGNLIGWQEFEYNDNPNYNALREQLGKVGIHDLEKFLAKQENLERIITRFNKAKSTLEKIKLIRVIGDMTEVAIQDEENPELIESAQLFLKQISADESQRYFMRTFAYSIYSTNVQLENWWTEDYVEKEDIDVLENIQNKHDKRFDAIDFEFTSEMINKLNYESRDYGTPSQITHSIEPTF